MLFVIVSYSEHYPIFAFISIDNIFHSNDMSCKKQYYYNYIWCKRKFGYLPSALNQIYSLSKKS